MTPSEIQAAIVAALAARYPAFTVEPHGGSFTEREMPLLLAKAPCLLVACIGGTNLAPAGMDRSAGTDRWRGDLTFVLYVFGADTATDGRAALALDTVFDVLTWLPDQNWGFSHARVANRASIRADNLYTGQVNLLRVAVWGLTWTQSFFFTTT